MPTARSFLRGTSGYHVWLAVACASFYTVAACAQDAPLGLPPLSIPADNAQTPEKIALGEKLFFDKRLSADGTISCGNCHQPDLAFADGHPVAIGLGGAKGTRNTPSLVNAAFATQLFWDGRRNTLEEQAEDPFTNSVEHGLRDSDAVLAKIRDDVGYVAAFKSVFQAPPTAIRLAHVVKAIAAFERTLVFGDSAFDRYRFGGDNNALSDAAKRGLETFQGRGKCSSCHSMGATAATFTDNDFHSLGVGLDRIEARLAETAVRVVRSANDFNAIFRDVDVAELGRFVVTRKPADIGRFRTPSLRNVALTAPYMHDGSVATLEEAVDLEIYYRGVASKQQIFFTAQEKSDLVEFLRSLTSAYFLKASTKQSASR